MRWQALFDDLEAQVEAAEAAELQAEVADRTRREVALLGLVDRLREGVGHPIALSVWGAGAVHGRLLDAGVDWLLLEESGGRESLVPLSAVLSVAGLGARSAVPGSDGEVGRRLDLRWALRGLARDRVGVAVVLRDGATLTGTLDRVGADHVDLAEHAPGEPRRAGAVRQVRTVPVTALALLRSS
jgi:hypothetical protein